MKSVFLHILEVAVSGLVALGLLALAVHIDPAVSDALSSPVAQLLGTLVVALAPKAAREAGAVSDYVNDKE